MVAYSYKRRFIAPIAVGLGLAQTEGVLPKRQTIRALGKRRHARPGEVLQHYFGMRTRQCFLIGTAICEKVLPVRMQIGRDTLSVTLDGLPMTLGDTDEFARRDGFSGLPDMHQFWCEEHPQVRDFQGVCIMWRPAA